jgi:hypothetical protein
MHPRRRRLALAQRMRRASRARSRPAIRAPLLQPLGVVAHDAAPRAVTGDDGWFRTVRASAGATPYAPHGGPHRRFRRSGRSCKTISFAGLICKYVIPPTGFEPVISCVKGRRPEPLDHGGDQVSHCRCRDERPAIAAALLGWRYPSRCAVLWARHRAAIVCACRAETMSLRPQSEDYWFIAWCAT